MSKTSYSSIGYTGVALAALAIVASLPALTSRYRVERANRAAGIAMEAETVRNLSLASEMTFTEGLEYLKGSGLTGVTLSEERVEDHLLGQDVLNGETRIRALEFAAALYGTSESSSVEWLASEPYASMAIGINPIIAERIQSADLAVIARLSNPDGVNREYIDTAFRNAGVGAAFLPEGDETLGFREELDYTAESLVRTSTHFLNPEFAKIVGLSPVAMHVPDQTIRLHSVQSAEAVRMSENAIAERFVRAFRERNIRWLLVRPGEADGERPIEDAGRLVARIREGVRLAGGDVKPPRPFKDPSIPPVWQAVPYAVAIFGLGLVGLMLAPERKLLIIGLATVAMLVPMAMSADWLGALIVALAAPTLALWVVARLPRPNALAAFAGTSFASLAAGCVIAAVLSDLEHLIRLAQFRGVKAAVLLPVLAVAYVVLRERFDIKALWNAEVRWRDAVLTIVGLGAAAVLLVRTGNDAPSAVSGIELQVRSLLDEWLYVRPRTKEWLIGHPSLLVGTWLLANRRFAGWGALLFVVGAIGQTSIVNTLTHLHTPLDVGLPRILIGLVMGGAIGGLLIIVLRRMGFNADANDSA